MSADRPPNEDHIFYRDLKKHYPLIVRGDGIYLYDDQGREIIDGAAGAAVVCLGHNNKRVMDAWRRQAEKVAFVHMSSFTNEPILKLSEEIAHMAGDEKYRIHFTSGGSEAVETALKVARQYHLEKGRPERHKVIARAVSYHGATIGALSLTGHHYRRAKFSPILFSFPRISLPYCYRCAFHHSPETCDLDCADDLERAIIAEGEELVSAFIFEPITGAAAPGVAPPMGYLQRIRQICEEHDILLIGDEVMTGVGRTGKFLASQHYQARPHIICLSKALSSGYAPLGAVMIEEEIYDVLKTSSSHSFIHGHTYGGHPASVATGIEVLKILREERLIERVAELGEYWLPRLEALKEKYAIVGDVRGKGLLLGIEFVRNSDRGKEPFDPTFNLRGTIQKKCLKRGLYVYPGGYSVSGVAGDHVLLAPPYIATESDLDRITEILDRTIEGVQKLFG
jgi:adenosylmethionine-8-amino-7-oxononanoate aminotransferase